MGSSIARGRTAHSAHVLRRKSYINLQGAVVSLLESSSGQLRSNKDLEGPENSNYC